MIQEEQTEDAQKFGDRYATFGFNDVANLTLELTTIRLTVEGLAAEHAALRRGAGDICRKPLRDRSVDSHKEHIEQK